MKKKIIIIQSVDNEGKETYVTIENTPKKFMEFDSSILSACDITYKKAEIENETTTYIDMYFQPYGIDTNALLTELRKIL